MRLLKVLLLMVNLFGVFQLHERVLNAYCVPDVILHSEDKKLNQTLSLPSRRRQSVEEKDTKQIMLTQYGKCHKYVHQRSTGKVYAYEILGRLSGSTDTELNSNYLDRN